MPPPAPAPPPVPTEDAGEAVAAPPAGWPDDSAESAMRAELRARGETEAPRPAAPPSDDQNLPPLATLVARLPADTRALLDELFRAKFIAVRRAPESALKS